MGLSRSRAVLLQRQTRSVSTHVKGPMDRAHRAADLRKDSQYVQHLKLELRRLPVANHRREYIVPIGEEIPLLRPDQR